MLAPVPERLLVLVPLQYQDQHQCHDVEHQSKEHVYMSDLYGTTIKFASLKLTLATENTQSGTSAAARTPMSRTSSAASTPLEYEQQC